MTHARCETATHVCLGRIEGWGGAGSERSEWEAGEKTTHGVQAGYNTYTAPIPHGVLEMR